MKSPKLGILSIGLIALLLSTGPAVAQTGTIAGTVIDSTSGETLPGVNVLIAGTQMGTATDEQGNYRITDLDPGTYNLRATFIGFDSKLIENVEVRSDQTTTVDIALRPSTIGLEEVVKIGYGSTERTTLTGSVSSVDTENLTDLPALRVDQLLRGQAAGAYVTSITGQPGTGASIRVRGGNSMTNNEPLYVVDGMIGVDDALHSLNPSDIASIEILKDAAATAIYGARGANGVVLITTKTGGDGEDRVNAQISRGWQTLPRQIDVMNAEQYGRLLNDRNRSIGLPPRYENPDELEGTNWQEEVTRTAPITELQLSATGGGDTFQYRVSGSYFDQRGIVMNSGYERFQFRLNFNTDITDRLRIDNRLNINRGHQNSNTINLGGTAYSNSATMTPPVIPVRTEQGGFAHEHPTLPFAIDNPVAQGKLNISESSSTDIMGNVSAEYDVLDGLTLESTLGVNANFSKNNAYNPGQLPTRRIQNLGGAASSSTFHTYELLNENTLTYDRLIGNHNVNVLAGLTYQTAFSETISGSADRFDTDVTTYNNLSIGDPDTRVVDTGYSSWSIISYLGRVKYSFLDRYIVTLVGRYDGSSRLGRNNRWGFFPSTAIAWRLGQEPFIEQIGLFSSLKVRASLGYVGNQGSAAEGIGPYVTRPTMAETSHPIGGAETTGFVPGNLAKPNLKWESTRQFNVGVDAGFFDERLRLTADYYRKRTSDLLLGVEIPWQTGYESIVQNVGAVENEGIEFSVQSTNVQTSNFEWDSSFNISSNKNTVVELGERKDEIITYRHPWGGMPGGIVKEGEPLGTFYTAVYLGTWKTQEEIESVGTMPGVEPGSPRYKDTNGDGTFSEDDFISVGTATPDFFGGLGNTFRYKDFSLHVFFQFSYGNKVFNGSDAFLATSDPLTNQYAKMTNRWTPENRDSDIPKVNSRDYVPSTRWIYDGSFLRLRTVQLTYRVPLEQLGMNWLPGATISLMGENLALWDSYVGYDPEVNNFGQNAVLRGYDYANYPQSRTLTVALDLTL